MPKFRLPLGTRKATSTPKPLSSSKAVPLWITAAGILGGIAFGILAYVDRHEEKILKQHEQSATAHKTVSDVLTETSGLGPVVRISQEADPIDHIDLAKALNVVDEVLEKNPKDARAHAVKGLILLKAGDDKAGAKLAHKALALDPELPNALIVAGLIDARAGNINEAKSKLEMARDSADQRDMTLERNVAQLNLAMILASQDKLDEARKELEEPLRNTITQTTASNTLGVMLLTEKRFSEASEAFLVASKDKSFLGASQNLACSYMLQGKTREYEQEVAELAKRGAPVPACDTHKDLKPDLGVKGVGTYWHITRDF